MRQSQKVEAGENLLVVSLSGDQRFVKVFGAGGALISHTRTRGVTRMKRLVRSGVYTVEADGEIVSLDSGHLDLSKNPLLQLTKR